MLSKNCFALLLAWLFSLALPIHVLSQVNNPLNGFSRMPSRPAIVAIHTVITGQYSDQRKTSLGVYQYGNNPTSAGYFIVEYWTQTPNMNYAFANNEQRPLTNHIGDFGVTAMGFMFKGVGISFALVNDGQSYNPLAYQIYRNGSIAPVSDQRLQRIIYYFNAPREHFSQGYLIDQKCSILELNYHSKRFQLRVARKVFSGAGYFSKQIIGAYLKSPLVELRSEDDFVTLGSFWFIHDQDRSYTTGDIANPFVLGFWEFKTSASFSLWKERFRGDIAAKYMAQRKNFGDEAGIMHFVDGNPFHVQSAPLTIPIVDSKVIRTNAWIHADIPLKHKFSLVAEGQYRLPDLFLKQSGQLAPEIKYSLSAKLRWRFLFVGYAASDHDFHGNQSGWELGMILFPR